MIASLFGIAVATGIIMAVIVIPLSHPQLPSRELQAVSVLVLVGFEFGAGSCSRARPQKS
jgi:hypothetical protein